MYSEIKKNLRESETYVDVPDEDKNFMVDMVWNRISEYADPEEYFLDKLTDEDVASIAEDLMHLWINHRFEQSDIDEQMESYAYQKYGNDKIEESQKLKESADTLEKLSAEVVELNKKKLSVDEMKKALSDLVDENLSWYKDDPEAEFEFAAIKINDEDYEFCVAYEDPDNVYAELDKNGKNYAIEKPAEKSSDIKKNALRVVKNWIRNCYGDSEARDPCYDMGMLVDELIAKGIIK